MKMKKGLLAVMLILCSLNLFATGKKDKPEVEITILHTNDVHSHLDADYKGRYGMGKAAAAVKNIRDTEDNVLLLDAGDFVMGTIYYTIFNGAAEKKVLSLVQYDAGTLGNHEFDKGNNELATYLENLEVPMVVSNIDFSKDSALKGKTVPYLLQNIQGREVAILGVTTPDTTFLSSPGEDITFNSPVAAIQPLVNKLEKRGADIIILLSHCGFEKDMEMASSLTGVDIIVGGHSHTQLDDRYPVEVSSASGEPVLIVQVGEYAKMLGQLKVAFDGQGIARSWEGNPILLDADAPVDTEVGEYVAALNEQLKPITSEIVGTTEVELTRSRTSESLLGNLITDAMLEFLEPQGVQIAITNAGGIRADVGAGDISLQALMEVLPFGNLAAVFEMKGSDLREVFEHGLSGIETNAGRFLQMSGARIQYNPNLPVGERLLSVQVKDETGTWVDMDPGAIYKVAANNYIRGGGDDFQVLKDKAIDPYDQGPLDLDILRAYFQEHGAVAPQLENRITVKE